MEDNKNGIVNEHAGCIGQQTIDITGGTVKQLTVPVGTRTAILQFNTDAAGVTAIGMAAMGYTPIAVLSEFLTPTTGFAGLGFKMFNMGMYEVRGTANLLAIQLLAFATGYNCYCSVAYYK